MIHRMVTQRDELYQLLLNTCTIKQLTHKLRALYVIETTRRIYHIV